MPRFLNKNNEKFARFSKTKYFVDKTAFINKLLEKDDNEKFICNSRPRRFGKTVNANMLGAYYTKGYDSHFLFDSLAVAGTPMYEKHINRYHVIHIDFSRMPDYGRGTAWRIQRRAAVPGNS